MSLTDPPQSLASRLRRAVAQPPARVSLLTPISKNPRTRLRSEWPLRHLFGTEYCERWSARWGVSPFGRFRAGEKGAAPICEARRV